MNVHHTPQSQSRTLSSALLNQNFLLSTDHLPFLPQPWGQTREMLSVGLRYNLSANVKWDIVHIMWVTNTDPHQMLREESGSKEEPQKRQLVLGLVLHRCYIGKGRGVEGGRERRGWKRS